MAVSDFIATTEGAMPRQSERFAERVKEVVGERSARNVARIVSIPHTTLLNWMLGDIPTESDQIRQFADGMKVARAPLLDAAGYKTEKEDFAWDFDHYGLIPEINPATDSVGFGGEYITDLFRRKRREGKSVEETLQYIEGLIFIPTDVSPANIREHLLMEGLSALIVEKPKQENS